MSGEGDERDLTDRARSWAATMDGFPTGTFRRAHADSATKIGSDLKMTNASGRSGAASAVWTGTEMAIAFDDARSGGSGVRFARISCCLDADHDGMRACMGDCNDGNASVYPGAPQVCDGTNNNCSAPGWPSLSGTNDFDDDGDGLSECAGDCNDTDGAVWAIPGDVTNLAFTSLTTTFGWTGPVAAGGLVVRYDTLRSSSASDFVTGATCIETNGLDTQTVDEEIPASDALFVYLVRGGNSCGEGSLGTPSGGAERTGRSCP